MKRPLEEVERLGDRRAKKQPVPATPAENVQRQKQQQIFSLFGTIEYDDAYDYKQERRKRTPTRWLTPGPRWTPANIMLHTPRDR